MSLRFNTVLLIIWITALFLMLIIMKKNRSSIRFILPWLFLDLIMCLVTFFPGILTFLCRIFGIETTGNMLFFFGMLFLVMIIFSMTLAISRLSEQVRDLAQRLALYENEKKTPVSHHDIDDAADNDNDKTGI